MISCHQFVDGAMSVSLTDVESRNALRGVEASVAEAKQGESSSALTTSSCHTDDDDSSTDSENEDFNDDPEEKWATADGYNLTTFDHTEFGTWAINQPLPLPLWAKEPKTALILENIYTYENMVALIEQALENMIQETYYDTVNNFIDFYQSFKKSSFKNLREFFQSYSPPVNRRHHMCVSLAMEIISRISRYQPKISEYCYLVSCQEAIEDPFMYIDKCEGLTIESAAWSLEKEHSLVAMRTVIAGREGMLIMDPGYHVSRVVTIMKDQCYPHTGFFTQSDDPECRREYCYTFSHKSDSFVTWRERTTRNGQQKYEVSLIYVGLPYKTAIDVTVRRNLVYDFRSMLTRDAKGKVYAGIYFPVKLNTVDASVTLFYDEGNKILKTKLKFDVFKDVSNIPETVMNHLKKLSPQMHVELLTLIDMLKTLAEIVADFDFVQQSLEINKVIAVLSTNNLKEAETEIKILEKVDEKENQKTLENETSKKSKKKKRKRKRKSKLKEKT